MEKRIRGELTLREALQEIDQGHTVIVLQPRTMDIEENDFIVSELCEWLKGCHLLLMETSEPAAKLPAPEPVEEAPALANAPGKIKPEKPKTRRATAKVDIGKVMALYEAGWTMAKIAGEMHMSDKTVWYHIDKARKERENAKA